MQNRMQKLRVSVWQNIKMKENALEHLFCLVIPTIPNNRRTKNGLSKAKECKDS